MNIKGYDSLSKVKERGMRAMSPNAFEAAANETGALVLDTREAQEFAKCFVPKSINIGIDGSFAPWVGALIPDVNQPLLIITDKGLEEEVITRLARVGYDQTIGFLEGGINAWKLAGKETDAIESIGAGELAERLKVDSNCAVVDVRKKSEYDAEHILGALNMPLDYVNDHLSELNHQKTYYVHCAAGYKSMIFVSILRARGYSNLVDVQGGFKAIKEQAAAPISQYVCPSTML
jgi:rhodanese-related sulfurtransferase